MRVIRKASLSPLRNKTLAIIGYGAQGRAQALNLRDFGYQPVIGLPTKSRSRAVARRDGLKVQSVRDVAGSADVLFVLAPDHLHGSIYDSDLAPVLPAGRTLVFAHASSVHFKSLKPRGNLNIILIAPLGPGKRLRELRGQSKGVACFIAVHQDPSGKSHALGLALARAIGCLPAGAVETTFEQEAIGDLFGEQAVLCGGLSALLQAGVETLVRHGVKPANAYLECVYQLDLIVDLIKADGIRGMFGQISPAAAYGAVNAGPRIISAAARREMEVLYADIESGRFFRRWLAASKTSTSGHPKLSRGFLKGETEVLHALTRSPRRSASELNQFPWKYDG